MKSRTKTGLAIIIAGFLAFLVLSVGAASERSGAGNKTPWFQQAEKAFYLSPGMGQKLLSRKQWEKFHNEMKEMSPERLSAFRLETHKSLMKKVHNYHTNAGWFLPDRQSEREVIFRTDRPAVLTFVASTSTSAAVHATAGTTGVAHTFGAFTHGTGAITSGAGALTSGTHGITPGTGSLTTGVGSLTPATGAITSEPAALTPETGAITPGIGNFTTDEVVIKQNPVTLRAETATGPMTANPRYPTPPPQTSGAGVGGTAAATSSECYGSSDGSSVGAIVRMSGGVLTERDADRMFPSSPEYSTARSVPEFGESRAEIFHRDFDIGPRDADRDYW